MTIDEAIVHAEEVASRSCDECANEHKQLAEWLKDYKRLLEQEPKTDYKSFCEWVASEIFDEYWEYSKGAFEEIACRKLAKLGIVTKTNDEWVYEEKIEQESTPLPLDTHSDNLARSIELNGKRIKKIICMEEMSELIQAISKNIRGKVNRDNIVEEMADVIICLDMLKIMYNVSNDELQRWIDYKVERQIKRDNDEVSG